MSTGKDHTILNALSSPQSEIAYRAVTGACVLLMTWWMFDLKTEVRDIRKDFTASQIVNESRMARVEGAQAVMDASIRMQTNSIQSHDNMLQQHSNRLYEMNARIPRDAK